MVIVKNCYPLRGSYCWILACCLASFASLAVAQSNLAPDGTPIAGASSSLVGGSNFAIVNQGALEELNDGVLVTDGALLGVQGAFTINANGSAGQNGNGIDTFAAGSTANMFDYVGIVFPEPVFGVTSVRVQHYLADDGGWWGPYSGPPTNAPLSAGDLTSPQVQVTTNSGTTWTNVATLSSDYVAQYTGVPRGTGFPNATAGPVATLTFNAQNNINGVRLIQNGAGNVDAGPGFIGVTEFEVFGIPQELTLIVNTATGAVSIDNTVNAGIAFDFYKITSPSGSLNPTGWNPLATISGNPPGFPAGDGSGNGWEVLGDPDDSLVAEAYLFDSSSIAPSDSGVNLGNLFALGGNQDLMFRYRTASGRFVDVDNIEYVSQPSTPGDYNNDGVVDAADYVVWRKAGSGDFLPNDPTPGVSPEDYTQWRANFGKTTQGADGGIAAVPEPRAMSLGLVGLAAVAFWRHSHRRALARPPRVTHALKCVGSIVTFATLILLVGTNVANAQQNFGSLLNEMVDRDRLAVHPNNAYTQHQASSYDRNSTALGAPFNYANADTANFLRTININGQTEYVLMEDTGPGALTRWWMTGTGGTNGQLRVYIDGQASPTLAGQIGQLLSGSEANFGESLSFQTRAGIDSGHNLYAPIPYSSSVLVTYRGVVNDRPGWNPPVYYNINYRKYQPSTNITRYTGSNPITYSQEVTNANVALANPAVGGNVTNTHVRNGESLAAGQSISHQLSGMGAIRRLNVDLNAADQAAALRNVYVELYFDGQRTAQVPIGHFFGNGESSGSQPFNAYSDFYRQVKSSGELTSFWVMPYQSAAEVRLVNRGAQEVMLDLEVDSGDWIWNSNSMHFHADHRGEENIATRGGNGTTDWTYLNVRGRGTYVGDTLAVRNGAGIWWGEGDEKVYIDYLDANGAGHNAQPDHIGTGTEDYYGYAWAHSESFSKPFIAQPTGAGNNAPGRSVNSRVRGLDAIPFDEEFKFDMELWHHANTTVDFGATTYWYGTPGAKSLRVAADLGADYRAGLNLTDGGIPDRAGDGQWLYLSSSMAEPHHPAAQTSPLSFGHVGNDGHDGYGGEQNGHNLAAISDGFLFQDGDANQGVQGGPGYHELALHPAGTVESGPWGGNPAQPYTVARWIAGSSSAGLANITGSIRNFVTAGDGVDFLIYVDGQLQFFAFSNGSTLPERHFDFDVTLSDGSIVDFVLGNKGQGNLFGDESLLSAIIWTDYDEFMPLEGDIDGDNFIGAADWGLLRDNFGSKFNTLSRRQAFALGDLNGDLMNDELDFALFKSAYEAAHGGGSFARLMQGVPEPSSFALLLFALFGWLAQSREILRVLYK